VLPALGVGELYLVSWGERAAALTDHARQSSRAPACRGRVQDARTPDGVPEGDGGEPDGAPEGDGRELDTGERVIEIAG
jgi:hypothetical protein